MEATIGCGILGAVLTPTERLEAVRGTDLFGPEAWTIWVPVLVAIALAAGLILAYRRYDTRRFVLNAFRQTAERLGLSPGERAVLGRITAMTEPKRLTEMYTMEVAFEESVGRLIHSAPFLAMSPEARQRVTEVIDSLRLKFGFGIGGSETEEGEDREVPTLERGDHVTLVRRGTPAELQSVITETRERDVTVKFDDQAALRGGEPCILRKVRRHLQWEFNATVLEPHKGLAVVRLIGPPRATNLRRFNRVVIQRTARLARFPFVHDGPAGALPQFVSGRLTEIAGPGLRLEAPLDAAAGSRVLVVLEVDPGRQIQGMGLVRRATPRADGAFELAVEMTGISEEEVADLVKQTNAAARRNASAGPARATAPAETA